MLFFTKTPKQNIRRHGQVVRHRSAKPLFLGSNPSGASKIKSTQVGCFLFWIRRSLTRTDSTEGAAVLIWKQRKNDWVSFFLSFSLLSKERCELSVSKRRRRLCDESGVGASKKSWKHRFQDFLARVDKKDATALSLCFSSDHMIYRIIKSD